MTSSAHYIDCPDCKVSKRAESFYKKDKRYDCICKMCRKERYKVSNMQKVAKIRSEAHRRFIASLPCCVCGADDVQAAHIRTGNGAGMGLKSGDNYCVPLCIRCHLKQGEGERKFWGPHLEQANALANALFLISKEHERGLMHVARFRKLYNA